MLVSRALVSARGMLGVITGVLGQEKFSGEKVYRLYIRCRVEAELGLSSSVKKCCIFILVATLHSNNF